MQITMSILGREMKIPTTIEEEHPALRGFTSRFISSHAKGSQTFTRIIPMFQAYGCALTKPVYKRLTFVFGYRFDFMKAFKSWTNRFLTQSSLSTRHCYNFITTLSLYATEGPGSISTSTTLAIQY